MLSEVVIWIESQLRELERKGNDAAAMHHVREHVRLCGQIEILGQLLGLIASGEFD